MHSTISAPLAAFCLAGALFTGTASAEPKAPTEEENADAIFAQGFLGKTYEGELEVEGWTDYGGGLVAPPISVHLYQREDGLSLVLTSKEGPASDSFVVTDALLISKPWKGYEVSIACIQGDDFTLRFIGEARGREDDEWWTEVRRAWAIEVEKKAEPETDAPAPAETAAPAPAPKPEIGKITTTSPKGVKCTNPSW
jgi:hypothetical protein